jgi:hypothetical protein
MTGHFQIGFANRKLGLTLPDKNRKAGEEMHSRLQRLCILRESGHEHFNGSVVFPIIDALTFWCGGAVQTPRWANQACPS